MSGLVAATVAYDGAGLFNSVCVDVVVGVVGSAVVSESVGTVVVVVGVLCGVGWKSLMRFIKSTDCCEGCGCVGGEVVDGEGKWCG